MRLMNFNNRCILICIHYVIFFFYLQDGPKVTLPKKKIEYLCYGSNTRADFIINNKDMFTVHIHKDKVREALCQVSLLA